jgi:hypothetical protein
MLVTVAEVKALITGLNSAIYTTAIETRIPGLENKIARLCNNHFIQNQDEEYDYGWEHSDLFVFTASTKKMENLSAAFVTAGFVAGDDIYIVGSSKNDGHFEIETITETAITMDALYTIKDENKIGTPLVYYVKWPTDLKEIAATMLEFDILYRHGKDQSIKSESIDDYSFTREEMKGAYPSPILKDLLEFITPRFV